MIIFVPESYVGAISGTLDGTGLVWDLGKCATYECLKQTVVLYNIYCVQNKLTFLGTLKYKNEGTPIWDGGSHSLRFSKRISSN
jgi:hypothetical protein